MSTVVPSQHQLVSPTETAEQPRRWPVRVALGAFIALLLGLNIQIRSAAYLDDGLSLDQLAEQVAASKFLLFKDGAQGPDFTSIYNQTALQAIVQGQWSYHWVWSIALPDGSAAQIYQRTD